MKTLLLALSFSVTSLLLANGAQAASVGVNFSKDTNGSLASTDVAGEVAQSSWNNVSSTTAMNLYDSTDTDTTIDLSITGVFNIWGTGAGTSNADQKLMSQAYQWGAGAGSKTNTATFSFSQIGYTNYDVYVYSPLAISYPYRQQSITLGSTTFWLGGTSGSTPDTFNDASDYTLATATSSAAAVAETPTNYVRFSNLSGSSFSVSVNAPAGSYNLGRIAGFQIVEVSAVPEAETSAMMVVGLGILSFMTRRRQRV